MMFSPTWTQFDGVSTVDNVGEQFDITRNRDRGSFLGELTADDDEGDGEEAGSSSVMNIPEFFLLFDISNDHRYDGTVMELVEA